MPTTFDEANVTKLVQELARAIEADRNKSLSEAMTIHKYVTPLLGALGWQVFDDTLVVEHPVKSSKVDIALFADGRPVAFVEAKRLRQNLSLTDDEAAQAMQYGYESGVNWCVLTNGERYEVYDAFAKVDHEKKLVVSFSVTEAAAKPDEELPKLRLLSREAVAGDELARFARESFARERVRELLEDPPTGVLTALHAHLKGCGMTEEDVRVGLQVVLGTDDHDGNNDGDGDYGVRAYVEPLRRSGDRILIAKIRQHKRTEERRGATLEQVRQVADLVVGAQQRGESVTVVSVRDAAKGGLRYHQAMDCLGILYVAGIIRYCGGKAPQQFAMGEPRSVSQVMERVMQEAQAMGGDNDRPAASSTDAKVGLRTYHGPVRREGERLLLQRARPRKGVSEERRVALADLREVADAVVRVHERNEAINVVSVTKATDNKVKYWRVKDCLGVVHVAGLLRHSRAQDHTLAESLTPDQIVERVLSTAQPEQ